MLVRAWSGSRVNIFSLIHDFPPAGGSNDQDNEGDKNENEEGFGKSSPFTNNVCHGSYLARVAVEAELVLVVAPCTAVTVWHSWSSSGHFPEGCVLLLESTEARWLAAAHLIMLTGVLVSNNAKQTQHIW